MQTRNKPRLVSKSKNLRTKHDRDIEWIVSVEKKDETPVDRLFKVIEEESCGKGYVFADNEFGMSYIRKEDIEDNGDGVFVIKFRFPSGMRSMVGVTTMADAVCKRLGAERHLFVSEKNEYGIPYCEGVWVIQEKGN